MTEQPAMRAKRAATVDAMIDDILKGKQQVTRQGELHPTSPA